MSLNTNTDKTYIRYGYQLINLENKYESEFKIEYYVKEKSSSFHRLSPRQPVGIDKTYICIRYGYELMSMNTNTDKTLDMDIN